MELLIPIQREDRSVITDVGPPTDWKAQKKGRAAPLPTTWDEVVRDEPHHRFYGRPWNIGRPYVEALKALGVRPWDRVLDLGCGAGRLGVWLIPYLWRGRYFGLDFHLWSLGLFSAYEAPLHALAGKAPRLLHTSDFAAEAFGVRFDVVIDAMTLAHLAPDAQERALERVARSCRPRARLISNSNLEAASPWRLHQERRIGEDDWKIFRLS